MVPKKVCKIVLKRCDAVTKSNMKRKQKTAEVENKDSPGVPVAPIKVENEFVTNEIMLTRITKGETSNAVTDNLLKSAANYCEGPVTMSTSDLQVNAQFPSNNLTGFKQLNFSQTDVVVKEEREEESNFLTGESVDCKTEADGRELALQQNVEELVGNVSVHFSSRIEFDSFSFPQTALCIKTEETVEEEIVGKNQLVRFTVADGALKFACNDDRTTAEHVSVLPDEWKNDSKMEKQEVEEGLVTSELVGRLPKGLEDKGASITTFPKILKIILKRCDATTKSNTKQNLASKVRNKDSPNVPAATLKVANERVLMQKVVKRKESVMVKNNLLDFHRLSTIRGDSVSKSVTSKKNHAKVMQAGNLKTYLTSSMPERRFECFHCSVWFTRKDCMTKHIHSKHCGNVDTCAYCATRVKKTLELRLVVRKKLCRHCSKSFLNRRGLQQHLRNQTGETQCPAQHCSVKFSHRCSLRAHLRSAHADLNPYACAQCPARFFMKGHLKQHLFMHSSERTYACSQCPAKFKCYNTLSGHLKTHSQERRFGCVNCSCRFKGKNALKRHLNIFHSGMKKSFVCDQCPASFYRKDGLKEHLLVHSKEKAFACHQCPAKFSTASKLKRHVEVHSAERPFKCKTCPKLFKSHRAMQRHAKIHSGVNLHACDQCPAKFVAPFMLRNHKEGHSNNTATCELCSKTLKSKKALEFHLKNVHSSNRPYSCPKCSLMFLSLSRLKIHSTMHTGARQFRCAQCPAKFMKRDDLSRHLVVHAENKPFVCAHCLAGFSQRGTLIGHLRRRHKESSPASFPNKR